ncbi:MAG: hypothetical protein IJ466_08845, partial [Clostridia bacterium]|nr:hypothetical protein [Clostridia bacterium]
TPAFVLSQDQTLMFNPYPHSFLSAPQLAKASALPETSQAFTLSESDCSLLHSRVTLNLLYSLYRFQGSFAFVLSLNAGFIIAPKHPFVNPKFQFFRIFLEIPHIV